MIFSETNLKGVYIVDIKKIEDNRGFFARAWCVQEFEEHGLNSIHVQSNIGFSPKKGTLRGMHYQTAPYGEVKLVQCTIGSIYDVIIDLRSDSPTCKQWLGIELTTENHRMVYIPEGFAHGYLTLSDNSEVFYQTSEFFSADHARGVRYDDPAFGINWPINIQVISDKDKSWPDYILSKQ